MYSFPSAHITKMLPGWRDDG